VATQIIQINREPVLTLWAKVVSERLAYKTDEALSLAKAVTGLNAQSKGRRLGIYEVAREAGKAPLRAPRSGTQAIVTVLGRPVPIVQTKQGLRASIQGEDIEPESVGGYLEKKFGEALSEVESAM